MSNREKINDLIKSSKQYLNYIPQLEKDIQELPDNEFGISTLQGFINQLKNLIGFISKRKSEDVKPKSNQKKSYVNAVKNRNCEGEPLAKKNHTAKIWTENEILHLLLCITNALYKLQELHVAHRDIKPANIILVKDNINGIWKLADFGVSVILQDNKKRIVRETVGTRTYMAPELKNTEHDKINPFLSDIYSLGKTIEKLLVDKVNKDAKSNDKIGKSNFRQKIEEILQRMIEPSPEKRIDIDQLKTEAEKIAPDMTPEASYQMAI